MDKHKFPQICEMIHQVIEPEEKRANSKQDFNNFPTTAVSVDSLVHEALQRVQSASVSR